MYSTLTSDSLLTAKFNYSIRNFWPSWMLRYAYVLIWYANGVQLSAIRENTALGQWIRCKDVSLYTNTLFIDWVLYFPISHEKKQHFSHDQVAHKITTIHCSSNYSESAIWGDTDIRIMVKTTTQSVIYTVGWYRYIRLIVKTTAQNVRITSNGYKSPMLIRSIWDIHLKLLFI